MLGPMLSVIVVVLVGIGFTRLTMLALELGDDDDLFGPSHTDLTRQSTTTLIHIRAYS